MSASAAPWPSSSSQPRSPAVAERSAGEGINHDVDCDLRRILLHGPLGLGELHVPFGAVVLVAVQHVYAIPLHDAEQVLVHVVVAPVVQLVAGGHGSVLEL